MNNYNILLYLLPVVWFLGCEVKPEPIAFGRDHCHYCKMSIVDPKFGGELVTSKGKIYKFDALECMISGMTQFDQEFAYTLGIAYNQPKKLVNVHSLLFVVSEEFNSPMGANLAAFEGMNAVDPKHQTFDWKGIIKHLSPNR